jgi:hypothetical protein
MAGRGATTFQKRQKEQHRREKRAEKLARRAERKQNPIGGNEIAQPEEVQELITAGDEIEISQRTQL